MPRETVRDKADRYLIEGRVVLVSVTDQRVLAEVRGEGAMHRTSWQAGAWQCTCPHRAATTDCSHVIALKRITAVDLAGGGR